MSLKEFQGYCLKENITFVSYIIPGDKKPMTFFLRGSDVKTYKNLTEMNEMDGFLIAPFQSENLPIVVLPGPPHIIGWDIELDSLPEPEKHFSHPRSFTYPPMHISTLSEYGVQVSELKKNIFRGKSQKIVLSRVKEFAHLDKNQLPDLFEELSNQYPNAFIYLIYTPYTGIWLGATPETLIKVTKGQFTTMALAGTKAYNGPQHNEDWTKKEIREHEYVANYLRKKLTMGGYRFKEGERENARAGNVEHLLTMFNGEITDAKNNWKNLVELLYPTPAICGTDDEATLPLIKSVEKHNREYYTGFIGPFNSNVLVNLFINIRCMKLIGNSAFLYAGGGILGESSVLKEWAETGYKFQTLIRVIQKVTGKRDILKVGTK